VKSTETLPGEGKFVKSCKGCGKQFRSPSRNTRFGPPELCKCAERRDKHRAKRRRERAEYHRDPETFRAKSRSRNQARRKLLAYFGVVLKSDGRVLMDDRSYSVGCNSPGCCHQFNSYLTAELKGRLDRGVGPRGAKKVAMKKLLKTLEVHHRDHNEQNNFLEVYPLRSNLELLCRTHHEHADRAKPKLDQDGRVRKHAELVLYTG
jgi:hypothetical protein